MRGWKGERRNDGRGNGEERGWGHLCSLIKMTGKMLHTDSLRIQDDYKGNANACKFLLKLFSVVLYNFKWCFSTPNLIKCGRKTPFLILEIEESCKL